MKYIKTYEQVENSDKIYFSIDIEKLTPNKIRLVAKKIAKMFPKYKISTDLDFLIDTDPKYLKFDYKEYKYINVHYIYVFLDDDNNEYPIIDGNMFLSTNSIEELINNLDAIENIHKYNL